MATPPAVDPRFAATVPFAVAVALTELVARGARVAWEEANDDEAGGWSALVFPTRGRFAAADRDLAPRGAWTFASRALGGEVMVLDHDPAEWVMGETVDYWGAEIPEVAYGGAARGAPAVRALRARIGALRRAAGVPSAESWRFWSGLTVARVRALMPAYQDAFAAGREPAHADARARAR